MSISKIAKKKALDYAERVYKIANPKANTSSGSAIRSMMLLPFSMIYSAVFDEQESLRNMSLGNFDSISEADMDILAGNLLQERPEGSRSSTTLRVYVDEAEPFVLEPFPYFSSTSGVKYMPIRRMNFNINDIMEDDGEMYVNVPIVSELFGPAGRSSAGEIQEFDNLPDVVSRINNITDTIGGERRFSNEEFYEYIRNSFNDGTTSQENGVRQFIADEFPEASEVNIVTPRSPRMKRDEFWTTDNTIPNLLRNGKPFASHQDIGTISWGKFFNRVHSEDGNFSAEMEGERISLDGDIEKFRTILNVINNHQAIISGDPLDGEYSAEVWGNGPHKGGMSDVYTYFPSVEIQSTVIDKREETTLIPNSSANRFYYGSDDINFNSGTVVYQPGSDTESSFQFTSRGEDSEGHYLQLSENHGISVSDGDVIFVYDMSKIIIGEDITDLPVMYVLEVDRLDPFSFESIETIPQSAPGNYNPPGWYLSNSDPAEVFSAKERKEIILDEKIGEPGFRPINIHNASIFGDGFIYADEFDFIGMEGRIIDINVPQKFFNGRRWDNIPVTVSTNKIEWNYPTITDAFVQHLASVGYRDDARIILKDGTQTLLSIIEFSDVEAFGFTALRQGGLIDPATEYIDLILPYIPEFHDPITPAQWDTKRENGKMFSFESGQWVEVISDTSNLVDPFRPQQQTDEIILATPEEFPGYIETDHELDYIIADGNKIEGLFSENTNDVSLTAEGQEGNFTTGPVRVVYATNSNIQAIQREVDDGTNRILCDDTLIRSVLPTVIDAEVKFKGQSTSEEVYNTFVDLLQEAVREVEEGERIRLDISNIISALSEEGLADSIDVNFEVRVKNFTDDGEYVVRYLNPSERTRQEFAVNEPTSSGVDRIILKRLKSKSQIPGRGKLILGGNDPDRQEIIPYEAVIENQDGTFTFIFRGQWDLQHDHNEWESAFVTVRDYDPDLEFKEGAIFIPSTNRPYVRNLVVVKR